MKNEVKKVDESKLLDAYGSFENYYQGAKRTFECMRPDHKAWALRFWTRLLKELKK